MSREIIVDSVVYDERDYPDFCDSYIESAYWKDTGNELTEEELDWLNDDSQFVYDAVIARVF
jgi:hypothetical protein